MVSGSLCGGAVNDTELHPTEKNLKIIQMLDQGKNMHLEVYEDDEGSTPLMEAAASGQSDLVKMLIEKIFKAFNQTLAVNNFINAKDKLEVTALMEAQRGGFGDIVQMLKAKGAK